MHDPEGIQTHHRSKRATADLRVRPRGHWDRRYWGYEIKKDKILILAYFESKPLTYNHRLEELSV